MRFLISILSIIFFLSACKSDKKSEVKSDSDIHKIIVQEVLQVNDYTYIRALEDGVEKWIATASVPVEIGKTYYFKKGMEMPSFESKELNRTFEHIYFVNKISDNPNMETKPEPITLESIADKATKPVIEKEKVVIKAVEGVVTIAELYKNRKNYDGKVIRVKGQVTKFNPAIMKTNWIHIQDGTEYKGDFDLTVTTGNVMQVGDVIQLEGKLALDKDFGAGYVYKLILENAVLVP